MNTESILTAAKSNACVVKQVIVFDWNDGPVSGICSLETPKCEFEFELIAERYNANDVDERIFKLSALPLGSVDKVIDLLSLLGGPLSRVWIPVWSFPSPEEQEIADNNVDAVLSLSTEMNLVLWTRNMEEFLGIWNVPERSSSAVTDWFSILEI